MSRIAIVAALEREVHPLVKQWRVADREHEGRGFRFFEKGEVALVCGGIGPEAARRAAEAIITVYEPEAVYSAGFAGALDPGLKVGDLVQPQWVINASDGSKVSLGAGDGVLVSFGAVASPTQKSKLRDAFGAQAVDMEAAAVGRAAELRGVRFAAVKVISDESDFIFPPSESFVSPDGRFLQGRFASFAAVRPWLWPRVLQMARNSNRASRVLSDRLLEISTNQISMPAGRHGLAVSQR